jgi:ankyrin repeat protein
MPPKRRSSPQQQPKKQSKTKESNRPSSQSKTALPKNQPTNGLRNAAIRTFLNHIGQPMMTARSPNNATNVQSVAALTLTSKTQHAATRDLLSRIHKRVQNTRTAHHMATGHDHVTPFRSDIHPYDVHGRVIPLLTAAERGNVNVVRQLLNRGMDPNVNYGGYTPLHAATQRMDPNVNYGGYTPLHAAAQGNHVGVIRLLLKFGGNPNTVNPRSDSLFTPMHEAVSRNKVEVVRLLIDYGGNVNAKDDRGYTPLHVACFWGNLRMAQVLLRSGANAKARNNRGKTPHELLPSWALGGTSS